MAPRSVPTGPAHVPPVQRIRLKFAKRGRLRFTSHRDFTRAFERALRRAEIPMAYSAGFHPHPKISYVGASPTGVASEAEYLEIALAEHRDPESVRAELDAVLPDGLDIVGAKDVLDCPAGSLTERIQASAWRFDFDPGTDLVALDTALAQFLQAETVTIQRLTKDGSRDIDARAAVVQAQVISSASLLADQPSHAILNLVVRQVTPTVRPDDVLTALGIVTGFATSLPVRVVRLAQGPLTESGTVGDPLSDID